MLEGFLAGAKQWSSHYRSDPLNSFLLAKLRVKIRFEGRCETREEGFC